MHSPGFEPTPQRLACLHSEYTDNRLVWLTHSATADLKESPHLIMQSGLAMSLDLLCGFI